VLEAAGYFQGKRDRVSTGTSSGRSRGDDSGDNFAASTTGLEQSPRGSPFLAAHGARAVRLSPVEHRTKPMKVNAKVVGYGPDPETTKALVNIIVEFSGPTETMTLTVIVPNEGDEAALKEQGIARAKDFALQFAADRS
jgi:hypothetical protein